MSQYDIYVLFLCLIVFVLLAGLSAVLLTYIVKLTLRLIRHGAEDEKIITEYEKALKKKAQKRDNRYDCYRGFVRVSFGLFRVLYVYKLPEERIFRYFAHDQSGAERFNVQKTRKEYLSL